MKEGEKQWKQDRGCDTGGRSFEPGQNQQIKLTRQSIGLPYGCLRGCANPALHIQLQVRWSAVSLTPPFAIELSLENGCCPKK